MSHHSENCILVNSANEHRKKQGKGALRCREENASQQMVTMK